MADPPAAKDPSKVAQAGRRAGRLAAELRANLKRRKAAGRSRNNPDLPAREPEKDNNER